MEIDKHHRMHTKCTVAHTLSVASWFPMQYITANGVTGTMKFMIVNNPKRDFKAARNAWMHGMHEIHANMECLGMQRADALHEISNRLKRLNHKGCGMISRVWGERVQGCFMCCLQVLSLPALSYPILFCGAQS